jgi:hypothetical protein
MQRQFVRVNLWSWLGWPSGLVYACSKPSLSFRSHCSLSCSLAYAIVVEAWLPGFVRSDCRAVLEDSRGSRHWGAVTRVKEEERFNGNIVCCRVAKASCFPRLDRELHQPQGREIRSGSRRNLTKTTCKEGSRRAPGSVTERLLKEAMLVATGDKQTRGTANKDGWYHTPKSHQSVAMAFGENAGLRDSACSDWPPSHVQCLSALCKENTP